MGKSRALYESVSFVVISQRLSDSVVGQMIELAINTGLVGDTQLNPFPFYKRLDVRAKDAFLAQARPDIVPEMSVEHVIESVTTELRVVTTPTKLKILTHPSCHQM